MAKLPLTPERGQIIDAAYAEWLAAGLSCEPADFDAAEAVVTRLYERIGMKRPYFVRLSSPLGAELYINLLTTTWPELAKRARSENLKLWDQLGGQLWDQLKDQLRGQLRDQLGDQLRDQLGGQLWDQLRGQLRGQLRDQLRDQLRGQLRDQLWDQLWDQLGDQLGGQLGGQQLRYMGTWFAGSWDYYWMWLDAGRRVGATYDPQLNAALDDHVALCRSIGCFYPFNDFCILTDRPELICRNPEGRLHSSAGPALRYRDGYSVWAINGARCPQIVVERPAEITVAMIEAERNQEVRRLMTERYRFGEEISGAAAYIRDCGAEILDHEEGMGTLRRRRRPGDTDLVMVEVINGTREPDGHFKHYWLRCHPELRPMHPDGALGEPQKMTARNAVASTYGLRGEQYQIEART